MRKLLYLITVIIFAGILSACASNNIPLTEEESDAIAQYCAHLLLKYDKNKTQKRKLLDTDELEDFYKEMHKNDPTSAPSPSPSAKPVPTKAAEDKNSVTPTQAGTEKDVPDVNQKEKAESLTEIYGKEGFTVEYTSGNLSKTYSENEYSTITAKDGEMTFIADFIIKNTGASKAKFVSNDSKVAYALYCDNGDIYAPEISMLSNDLMFLNDEIDKNKEYKAVLLFIIDDKRKPVKLIAEDGETGKVFEIHF